MKNSIIDERKATDGGNATGQAGGTPAHTTIWERVGKPEIVGNITIAEAMERCRSDERIRSICDGVRAIYDRHEDGADDIAVARKAAKIEAAPIKNQLPSITPSARLKYRNADAENLIEYTDDLHTDIDGYDPEMAENLKQLICDESSVRFGHTSPSGRGFKIGQRIKGLAEEANAARQAYGHEAGKAVFARYWRAYTKRLKDVYGLENDENTKDFSRLSYLAHDPNAYYNPNPEELDLSEYLEPADQLELGQQAIDYSAIIPGAVPLRFEDMAHQRPKGYDHGKPIAEVVKAALAHVLGMEAAVEGANGSNQTLRQIRAVVDGFALHEHPDLVLGAMVEAGNQGAASPPWPRKELERKIGDVLKKEPELYTPGCLWEQWLKEQEVEEWPEVQPLDAPLVPVMPIPWDCVQPEIAEWVKDIADRTGGPPEYTLATALAVAGSLIGRQVGIKPLARDDWKIVSNLWAMIIGDPSMMKSPMMDPPLAIFRELEIEHGRRHDEALKEYNREAEKREIYQAALKDQRKKAIQAAAKQGKGLDEIDLGDTDIPDDELPPERRRFYTSDATIEKVGELATQNPNGMAVVRDELNGWLRTMDRSGHEADRAFYLESWNGTNSHTVDRIGRGTTYVEALCLSIIGSIQPGIVADIVAKSQGDGDGADGLIQRFQLTVWPDAINEYRVPTRWPNTEAKAAARAALFRLVNIDLFGCGATPDDRLPYLEFTDAAQVIFNGWMESHHRAVKAAQNEDMALSAHIMKYRKLCPALALIDHLLGQVSGSADGVGVGSVNRAIGLCQWLESHARRLYSAAGSRSKRQALALLEHIRKGELVDGFTVRDVQRKGWAGLKERSEAEDAVEELAYSAYLRPCKVQTTRRGGRPTTTYDIHPSISGQEGGK